MRIRLLNPCVSSTAFAVLMPSSLASKLATYPKAETGSHGLAPPAARRHSDPHDYPPPNRSDAQFAAPGGSWPRKKRRPVMKKLLTLLFALSLFTSLSLVAQDTTQNDQMKHTSTKAASVTGKISDDAGCLGGGVFHLIVLRGVLSHQAKRRKKRKGEEKRQQFLHYRSPFFPRPTTAWRRKLCVAPIWGRVVVRVRMSPRCGRR